MSCSWWFPETSGVLGLSGRSALQEVGTGASTPELSPDGSAVAYLLADFLPYVRRLDSLEARLMSSTRASDSVLWFGGLCVSVIRCPTKKLLKARMPAGWEIFRLAD